MNNEILKGAKFGDRFITENGRNAVVVGESFIGADGTVYRMVAVEDEEDIIYYNINGKPYGFDDDITSFNIVLNYNPIHNGCNNNPDLCVSSVCPETCSKFKKMSEEEFKKIFAEWLSNNIDITFSEDNRDKIQNLLDRCLDFFNKENKE